MSSNTIAGKNKPWRLRIVGYGEIAPDQVLANEKNWRIHPKATQQDPLSGVLREVGIVQNIMINKRTSEQWPEGERNVETLVDGHLRVQLALREGQPSVPVTYVDLTPAEEAEVLATLDPIGALAIADKEKLDELLREVETGEEAVQQMLEDLATGEGLYKEKGEDRELEEIDVDTLPECPVWALCTFPTAAMPQVNPLLEQLRAAGVTVEIANV